MAKTPSQKVSKRVFTFASDIPDRVGLQVWFKLSEENILAESKLQEEELLVVQSDLHKTPVNI